MNNHKFQAHVSRNTQLMLVFFSPRCKGKSPTNESSLVMTVFLFSNTSIKYIINFEQEEYYMFILQREQLIGHIVHSMNSSPKNPVVHIVPKPYFLLCNNFL